jgi:hypothetical protein
MRTGHPSPEEKGGQAAVRQPWGDVFEALFACSPLVHQVTQALRSQGVEADIEPGSRDSREAVIHIPADEKEAAIDIVLRALPGKPSRRGPNTPPARGLAA